MLHHRGFPPERDLIVALTPEIMEAVERVTAEMWPGVPAIPLMSTGATDSLYFRRAGIPM